MEKRTKEMLHMYESGYSYGNVGKKFGISRQRVQQILKNFPHKKRTLQDYGARQYKKFSDNFSSIIMDYESGVIIVDLVKKYKISIAVMNFCLHSHYKTDNLNRARTDIKAKKISKKVKQLQKDGVPLYKISEELKVSRYVIDRVIYGNK